MKLQTQWLLTPKQLLKKLPLKLLTQPKLLLTPLKALLMLLPTLLAKLLTLLAKLLSNFGASLEVSEGRCRKAPPFSVA